MAKGSADDIAIICYTSGTTGQPKGTMLSHRNLVVTGRNAIEYEGLRPTDEVVAYLPMAWIGDHMFSFAQSILTGFTTNCPESSATVLHGSPGDRADVLLRAAGHLPAHPDRRP